MLEALHLGVEVAQHEVEEWEIVRKEVGIPLQCGLALDLFLDVLGEEADQAHLAHAPHRFERKDLPDARRKLRIMVLAIRLFLW